MSRSADVFSFGMIGESHVVGEGRLRATHPCRCTSVQIHSQAALTPHVTGICMPTDMPAFGNCSVAGVDKPTTISRHEHNAGGQPSPAAAIARIT